jgi:hypothetical protein
MERGTEPEQTGYVLRAVSWLLAILLVGSFAFVVLRQGASMVSMPPPSADPPAAAEIPLLSPAISPVAPAPSAPIRQTGVAFRCMDSGTPSYSDLPCPGGTIVDLPITQGFQRGPRLQPSQRNQVEHRAPLQAASEPATVRSRRCEAIEAEIDRIDALARQGQSAASQDNLRAQRLGLADERYALKC